MGEGFERASVDQGSKVLDRKVCQYVGLIWRQKSRETDSGFVVQPLIQKPFDDCR
jgi:hypothetical protein